MAAALIFAAAFLLSAGSAQAFFGLGNRAELKRSAAFIEYDKYISEIAADGQVLGESVARSEKVAFLDVLLNPLKVLLNAVTTTIPDTASEPDSVPQDEPASSVVTRVVIPADVAKKSDLLPIADRLSETQNQLSGLTEKFYGTESRISNNELRINLLEQRPVVSAPAVPVIANNISIQGGRGISVTRDGDVYTLASDISVPTIDRGYVFGQGSAWTDSSVNPTIWFNKTSATGDLVNIQVSGTQKFLINNAGQVAIGASSASGTLDVRQNANGATLIYGRRFTDSAPSGDLIKITNAAGDTDLFRVDNSGGVYAGSTFTTGSQTITSTTTPQLRVQYNASNESTVTVSSAGVVTHAANGTTPRIVFLPQSNRTDTFEFQNASGTPVATINTTVPGLNIAGTLSVGGITTISAAARPLVVNATNSNENKIELNDNGTARGYIGASATNSFMVRNSAANQEWLTINNSSGAAAFNGAVSGITTLVTSSTITAGNTINLGSGASGGILSWAGASPLLRAAAGGSVNLQPNDNSGANVSISGTTFNFGGTFTSVDGFRLNQNQTASASAIRALSVQSTLTAAGNGDDIRALAVSPTLAKGAFTGLNYYGIIVNNSGVTGAGTVANAYQLYLDTPPAATNAYAIYVNGGQSYFSGNVGIGDLTPDGKLDVEGDYAYFDGLRLRGTDSGNTIWQSNAATDLSISTASGNFYIKPSGSTAITALTDGKVGIGTSGPSQKLHLSGGVALFNNTAIGGGADVNSGLRIVAPISTTHYNWMLGAQQNVDGALEITPSTAAGGTNFSTPTAVFLRTGSVGIGNTNPGNTLQVGQSFAANNTDYSVSVLRHGTAASPGTYTSGLPAINITDWSADGPATLDTLGLLDVGAGRIADADTNAANALLFRVANDTGVAVAVNGKRNVGIGTTSPLTKLHVEGTDVTTFSAGSTDGQQTAATITVMNASNTDNTFSQIRFGNRASGFGVARIVAEAVAGGDNVNLRFVTEGGGTPATRLTITNTGAAQFGGVIFGGGTTLGTGVTDNGVILPNNTAIWGNNVGGTNNIKALWVTTQDNIALSTSSSNHIVIPTSSRLYLDGSSGAVGDDYIYTQAASRIDVISGAVRQITIDGAVNQVRFPNISTTASAANVFVDSGNENNLLRSTSSLRYKTDVRNINVFGAQEFISSLRPVVFKSLASADDPTRDFVGLIAEEVATLDTSYVNFMNGVPDGVQYDRIVVPMITYVQDLNERISTLETNLNQSGPSTQTVASVIDNFQVNIKLTVLGDLEVGTSENPTGITLYDKATGQPFCLEIENGSPISTAGKCGIVLGESVASEEPITEEQPAVEPEQPTEPTPTEELTP